MVPGDIKKLPTQSQVEQFEVLAPILDSILSELKELSKQKKDESLNLVKVRTINKILKKLKETLSDNPAINILDLLDEESFPMVSDAILIVATYNAAMDQFKNKYFLYDTRINNNRWFTQENPT